MARITVEDCLENVSNRFALVHLAKERAKQILAGSRPRLQSSNKPIVVSLREIAAGQVRFMSAEEAEIERELEEQARSSSAHDDLGLPPPKLVMDDPFGPDDLGPDDAALMDDISDDGEEPAKPKATGESASNGATNGSHAETPDSSDEF